MHLNQQKIQRLLTRSRELRESTKNGKYQKNTIKFILLNQISQSWRIDSRVWNIAHQITVNKLQRYRQVSTDGRRYMKISKWQALKNI